MTPLIMLATGLMLCGVAAPIGVGFQSIAAGTLSFVLGIVITLVSVIYLNGYRV